MADDRTTTAPVADNRPDVAVVDDATRAATGPGGPAATTGLDPAEATLDADGPGIDLGPQLDQEHHDPDPTRQREDPANRVVVDSDGDGLSDDAEADIGTDPTNADTDGDGLTDGYEVDAGTDPSTTDTDGDGLSDFDEIVHHGTDPTELDTDGDGLDHRIEVGEAIAGFSSVPTSPDTDADGLGDLQEFQAGSDPLLADTDGDGLSDSVEVTVLGTDPRTRTPTATSCPTASSTGSRTPIPSTPT